MGDGMMSYSSLRNGLVAVNHPILWYSMDWIKGNFTGKPHIQWENLWFPVNFPLNQSIEV